MSFFRRIFSKKNDEDYETILSNLANDIQKRQLKLSEIRLRERRSTLLTTLYTLGAWVAYVSVWYLDALPAMSKWGPISNHRMATRVKVLPVIFGPVVILFIRRIVQIWYKRKGDAEEKTLKILMKERRDKVEEIKKKTNYYSTRDLIQRYDEPSPATPLRPRIIPGQPLPATPQPQSLPNNMNPNGKTPGVNPALQAQLSPITPPFPAQPQRRQWYDRLADTILGDDDSNIGSPSSRYALICEKCFTHNGLVKESMWEDAQYVCPKCNHFNASTRSKRLRQQQNASPTASATSSPSAPASVALTTPQRQPSPANQPHSPQESDLPNVDPMEVDTEVDAST